LLKHKDVPRTTPEIDAILLDAGTLRPGIEVARALSTAGPMAPIVARAILYESRAASQRALAAWVLVESGDRDEELLEPLVCVLQARDMALVTFAADALGRLGNQDARAPLLALADRLHSGTTVRQRRALAAALAALQNL